MQAVAIIQDTLAKADELFSKGNVQSARKHWEFAVNNVAPHAKDLRPASDGLYGNVKLWRDGIAYMSQQARDRCVPTLFPPAELQPQSAGMPLVTSTALR